MAINPVSINTALDQQSKTDAASTQLSRDFNDFLILLTTQLQNQDPLSPMDTTEFTNQLVAFAGVEQQINTNQKLDSLVSLSLGQSLGSAQSYVGKQISYISSEFNHTGVPSKIKYSLGAEAVTSKLSIYDEGGKVVYSVEAGKSAGVHDFIWDGSLNSGGKAEPGTYEVKVDALDINGEPVQATSVVSGLVRGTEAQNGQIYLLVGDRAVALSNVLNTGETGMGNNNSDGLTMALNYVGLDVTYNDNEVVYSGSGNVNVNYTLKIPPRNRRSSSRTARATSFIAPMHPKPRDRTRWHGTAASMTARRRLQANTQSPSTLLMPATTASIRRSSARAA